MRQKDSAREACRRIRLFVSKLEFLDKAFAVFQSERPGPVYLEVPVDLFADAACKRPDLIPVNVARPAAVVEQVTRLLNSANAPLLLVGGDADIASKGTTVCLIGDGGLQFCLSELIVAVQEQAHVVFIVWNNQGYGEIERYMRSAGVESVGVALHTPDFVTIAVAMGLDASRPTGKDALEAALVSANRTGKPTLIEIDERMARSMDLLFL